MSREICLSHFGSHPLAGFRPPSARLLASHSHALHRLEQFAFRLDGGSDDDLSLLKLANGARPNVAHARGDGTNEILAAVIEFGGAEEDLLERAGHTPLDAGSARQVRIWGGHAPMESCARGFLRSRKRTADHDRIRAAGERLANVASFVHPAVCD